MIQPKNDYPPPRSLTAKAPEKWMGLQDSPASYWVSVTFSGAFAVKLREGTPLKTNMSFEKGAVSKGKTIVFQPSWSKKPYSL